MLVQWWYSRGGAEKCFEFGAGCVKCMLDGAVHGEFGVNGGTEKAEG